MPSPDFSSYVDLTPYDAQPAEIYSAAVEYATTSMPDFSPRTGTVEDAMLQSMSYVSGFLVAAINRLPNSLMEGVLNVFGFARNEATLSSGTVVLSLIGDAGTIYAGTQLAYEEIVDGQTNQYVFTSLDDISITEGDLEVEINVISANAGVIPTIASGSTIKVLTANSLIVSAVSGTITSGQDGEDDTSYFTRAVTYFQSLSDGLITPRQIEAHTLSSYPVITRVKALSPALRALPDSSLYDMTGIDRGIFVGHVLMYLLSTGNTFTDEESLVEIGHEIEQRSVPGLTVDASNPILIKLASNAVVEKLSGYDRAVVRANVVTELTNRINPGLWDFGTPDISSAILSSIAIKYAEGVSYVYSLGLAVKGFEAAASITPFGDIYETASAGYTNLVMYDLASTEFVTDSFMPTRAYTGTQFIGDVTLKSVVYQSDGVTELDLPSSFEIVRKGYKVVGNGNSGENSIRIDSGDFGHAERALLFKHGLLVEGSGVPANTFIVSVSPYSSENLDLQISENLTANLVNTELTIASTTALTIAGVSASIDAAAVPATSSIKPWEISSISSPLSNGTYVTLELAEAHEFAVDDTIYVTGLKHLDLPSYNPFVGEHIISEIPSATSIKYLVSYQGEIDSTFGASGAYVFSYPNYSMSTLLVDFDIPAEAVEANDITNPDYNSAVTLTHYGYLPKLSSADISINVSE